ncbi:4-amino-4-deoxy-L-arabinose-phosphoundecaprenol flippase subunit ArnF [Erwinia aphidicola]|uniref:4-amino-4-deoxy-L-arabinose-phosphoundecaprenol flippase subunit ArnF n=1 Tax=Erwinia aphidicola TaxID=68334 RepID=UPI003D1E44D4
MMGYVFALCSVMLVTLAQLMLRWSMVRLPGIQEIAGQWQPLSLPAVIALCAGLLAYTLSMLCWMLALRRIALSRAYPLLSLSYVLVWLLAIALPIFSEPFHIGALIGVLLIIIGLVFSCLKPAVKKR